MPWAGERPCGGGLQPAATPGVSAAVRQEPSPGDPPLPEAESPWQEGWVNNPRSLQPPHLRPSAVASWSPWSHQVFTEGRVPAAAR